MSETVPSDRNIGRFFLMMLRQLGIRPANMLRIDTIQAMVQIPTTSRIIWIAGHTMSYILLDVASGISSMLAIPYTN